MKRSILSHQQKIQEAEYGIPYHYKSLFSEEQEVWDIEYLDYLLRVKKKLSPFTGQKILDVGCGDGRFFHEVRGENVILWGVDYSERAIQFARAFNPSAQFVVGGVSDLPPNESFDAIVMIEVLEHIPPSQISRTLREISRRLKKGGKLVITVPSVRRGMVEKHYQHFTETSFREALSPHFNVVKVEGYGRVGLKKRMFNVLRRMCLLFFPFKDFFPFFGMMKGWIRGIYSTHLGYGSPDECTGLLAECIPK
jgi:ubiquinone/menaquinone biosynthesis C-methylase UbiE